MAYEEMGFIYEAWETSGEGFRMLGYGGGYSICKMIFIQESL